MSEYIEREKVYEMLHNIGGCDAENGSWANGWDKAIDTAIAELENIPAADVEPDKIDLKPCPFCGTTDDVYSEFNIRNINAVKQHEIRIGCDGCGFYLTLQCKSKVLIALLNSDKKGRLYNEEIQEIAKKNWHK